MARILIVDDEEGIRATFEIFLSEAGHEVSTAKDYHEAVARIDSCAFDMIFADIVLKGRTGLEFLCEIKKRGLICPVVMITGYPDMKNASEAVRLGAFDYLIKPVEREELMQAMAVALNYKAVKEESEKRRANIEAIFRSVRDAIITFDKNLNVVEMNEAASHICGISRLDSIGKSFQLLSSPCAKVCIDILQETIKMEQPLEKYRLECNLMDCSPKVVNIASHPLLDRQGGFSGCVLVIKDETRLSQLEKGPEENYKFHRMIGKNRRMQEVYSLIGQLAALDTTVLITGPSGTGKELAAEALHHGGKRKKGPLVKVACSALSDDLLESELFGHVRGAFTGAVENKIGRFQRSHGGTIFLDEIGDISPKMQLHLLRVLQEKEFERLGDPTPVKVDVRILAATNQDLKKKMKLGKFREDLFYRLNVVELRLPSLKERADDIPLLAKHFLAVFSEKSGKKVNGISEDALKILVRYHWPGNVRELEHAMERAVITARRHVIAVEDLPADLKENAPPSPGLENNDNRQAILKALEAAKWNKSGAARILGVDRKTLYNKIKKYEID